MRYVLLLFLIACSKPTGEPGACFRLKDNACVSYGAETASAGKAKCAGFEWRATCPADNRLGTCTSSNGAEQLYSGPPNAYDLPTAKKICESSAGTFSP